MSRSFRDRGVEVITEGLFFTPGVTNTRDVVDRLNTTGARIVVLNTFESFAREIFCSAYRRGMIYPDYVFISYYFYSEFWWTDPISGNDNYVPDNCTVPELTDAIYRSLAVDYFPMPTPEEQNRTTDVGFDSPNAFWQEFVQNVDDLSYLPSEALRQASHTYDAVWAAAFALHNASLVLGGMTPPRNLSEFDYDSSDINEIILRAARGVDFQGVSGRVLINEFGDREPTRQMFQYRFTGDVVPGITELPPPFARVDNETGLLIYSSDESPSTVFPGGVPQAAQELFVHPALFSVYTILCGLGIVFAIVCIVFNLVFRKKKIVKLSSPFLNVVIIVGAIFFYVVVILFGIDDNIASSTVVDGLCQAPIWIASIGFSLFFGTILAKTWRVYYIFRSVRLKKKPMKDWVLFIIVAVFVAIDLVFLIIVTPIWRLKLTQQLLNRQGGEIPFVIDQCASEAASIWIPVLLAYKCLFLVAGLFLAIETYNVKIKELRDSKLIFFSIIGIVVISIVIGVIAFLVNDNPNATYALLGFFIMSLITGILILLFGTRMVELYKNPGGEVELSTIAEQKSTLAPPQSTIDIDSSIDSNKIAELKETIRSLKAQINAANSARGGSALNEGGYGGERNGSNGANLEMERFKDNGGHSQDANRSDSRL